jgi:hypothetical protein
MAADAVQGALTVCVCCMPCLCLHWFAVRVWLNVVSAGMGAVFPHLPTVAAAWVCFVALSGCVMLVLCVLRLVLPPLHARGEHSCIGAAFACIPACIGRT